MNGHDPWRGQSPAQVDAFHRQNAETAPHGDRSRSSTDDSLKKQRDEAWWLLETMRSPKCWCDFTVDSSMKEHTKDCLRNQYAVWNELQRRRSEGGRAVMPTHHASEGTIGLPQGTQERIARALERIVELLEAAQKDRESAKRPAYGHPSKP